MNNRKNESDRRSFSCCCRIWNSTFVRVFFADFSSALTWSVAMSHIWSVLEAGVKFMPTSTKESDPKKMNDPMSITVIHRIGIGPRLLTHGDDDDEKKNNKNNEEDGVQIAH